MLPERETPCPVAVDCEGKLHPLAKIGLIYFDQGEYWKAHEALEEAWKKEPGQIRHLYRGILQVGVAYLHIRRGNYEGAMKLYQRSKYWLDPFPKVCRGVDVGRLQSDLEAVIAEIKRLGPDKIAQFDTSLLKPAVWDDL